MDNGSFGAWIPVWILGAPLVIGLLEWLRTPKTTTTTTTHATRAGPSAPAAGWDARHASSSAGAARA